MTIDNDKLSRLIKGLEESPTALVCNAYEFLGMYAPCADSGIAYMTPVLPPLVGQAVTIKLCFSSSGDEYIAEAERGGMDLFYEMITHAEKAQIQQVCVIQVIGEKTRDAVVGDGMAKLMTAAGAVGCITNGAVRDIEGIEKSGLKLFGSGAAVNVRELNWSGFGEPVAINGLTINTGDIVHGDRDGIITLPEAGWGRVVEACRIVQDFEKAAHVIFRRNDILAFTKKEMVGALVKKYSALVSALTDE